MPPTDLPPRCSARYSDQRWRRRTLDRANATATPTSRAQPPRNLAPWSSAATGSARWARSGTGYPHLHYEQLSNPNSESDADNQHIVNPVLQGQGPLVMNPNRAINMVSINTVGAHQPSRYYWVDTFEDAPVFGSPDSTRQTGTLKQGRSYVYCKVWGREIRVGPNYNHWWVKTDPDVGEGRWVSAYYLTHWGNDEAKDNNGTVIPDC